VRGAVPSVLPTLVVLAALAPVCRVLACDICAVYTATTQQTGRTGFQAGVAEQYSFFGTERLDGHEVTLPADEHMDSSVTQFFLGYRFTPRVGVQVTIPYIDRSFTRIRNHELEHGTESGLGDVALLANLVAFRTVVGESLFQFSLLGGIKFPTGSSDRLGEEFVTPAAAGVAAGRRRASVAGSTILPLEGGLHGHDLALGSGSFDGIAGGQVFWSWRRWFVGAGMQYAIRSTGDFDYRYANDLSWVGGPGWFALLSHDYSLGLQGVISGETKGNDTQQGRQANDTAVTALYLGPGVSFTWRSALSAEVAVDLPVIQHNTGLQLLPDYRVRGGLAWHF